MADLGGGTRGTFTLDMLYQCTVAKASSRVPRSPLGGGAAGGIKAAWFLVVRDAANGFDCERSGSVRDRGPPPAILCKPEVYRAQEKSAGGWRATVSGHDAGRGCSGGCVARSLAGGVAAGAINVALRCRWGACRCAAHQSDLLP